MAPSGQMLGSVEAADMIYERLEALRLYGHRVLVLVNDPKN